MKVANIPGYENVDVEGDVFSSNVSSGGTFGLPWKGSAFSVCVQMF